jgi:hypothetical protein
MPHGLKVQIVKQPVIEQPESIQQMRHGENNMKMFYRQCFTHQLLNPDGLFSRLTFRTMPIATTVVAVTHRTARLTGFFVSAQHRSTAPGDIVERFLLACV